MAPDAVPGHPAPDATVDATGLLCPLPVLRADAAARRLAAGDVVLLLADDEGIVKDLPAWCAGRGHVLLAMEPSAGTAGRTLYRCWVRVSG